MKTLKLQIDDKILETIEHLALELGMKPTNYIQMLIGMHVKEKGAHHKEDAQP